jgi:ubiquitin-conjugating enzyme E2 G1
MPFSEGGFFKALLTFPHEFPLLPPKMRFITPMWHPNSTTYLRLNRYRPDSFYSVYADGVVCVSILASSCSGFDIQLD